MPVSDPPTAAPQKVALSHATKTAQMPLAKWALWFAAAFQGVAIALQVAALAPYPGTAGDPVLKVLTYIATFMVLATFLKFAEVALFGDWLEGRLGTKRPVRFRDVLSPRIQRDAWWGGVLQAAYSVLFVALVSVLPGSTLTAAKALVVVILPFVEMQKGVIKRRLTHCGRLAAAIAVTMGGSALVIVVGGFRGFTSYRDALLFMALITIGNLAVAYAEWFENEGVHHAGVAAGTYTLARFITFAVTCVAAALIWGLVVHHHAAIMWAVVKMCASRWELLLPIALLAGGTDLFRISVKPVVSATFQYVILASSLVFAILAQDVAKYVNPKLFSFVKDDWLTTTFMAVGLVVIVLGAMLFPHPREDTETIINH